MRHSERVSRTATLVLAVDGNSLVHRAFHGQARTGFRSVAGRPLWAVRGLLSQLAAAVDRVAPDAVVVGFDDPDSSVRREQSPGYKAHRAEKLPALVDQLALAREVLGELGVSVVVPPGLEADDVLASAAEQARRVGGESVIVTSDRDAFGLIDGSTRVLRIINGGVEASPLLTPDRLVLLLGVRPDQYADFAALRGDPSDNLPGVRGFGPRKTAQLLAALGSVEAAFADLAAGGSQVIAAVGPTLATRLAEPSSRQTWEFNRAVMTMQTVVPVDIDAGRLPLDAETVRATFRAHDLHWTTTTALRAFAHQAPSEPRPPTVTWDADWSAPRRRPALPRLPVRRQSDQMTLF
jgi:DNA polymerase-1